MNCPTCKTENPEGTRYCVNCGAPLSASQPSAPPQPHSTNISPTPPSFVRPQPLTLKTNGLAVASLILGLLSLCSLGFTGLIGLILGIVALVQIGQPRSGQKGTGLAVAGIATSIVLPIIMLAIALPFYFKARQVAQGPVQMTICLAQTQALAQAATQYAADHQGTLPTADQFWGTAPETLRYCPTKGKGAIGYGYFQDASGKSLKSLPSPATMPIIADGGNTNHVIVTTADIDKRHMGGYNQAFVDGHAESLGITKFPGGGTPPPGSFFLPPPTKKP